MTGEGASATKAGKPGVRLCLSPDASGKVVKVTETIIQLDPSSAKAEIARSAAMQAPALPTPTEVVITTGPQDPPRAAVAPNPNASTDGTRRFPGLFKGNRPQQANAFTPPVQANTQPIMMPIASAPPMAYPNGVLQAGFFPNDPNFVMERGDPNAFQSNDPRVAQLIKIMTDGLLPSQREWAVMRLAECDTRVHPVVHAIFAHYAVQDQSGSVRAACIHQLGRTNAPIPFAYRVVNALRNDPDVRVQTEVGEIAIRYKVR